MDIDIAEFFVKSLHDVAEVDLFDEEEWKALVALELAEDRLHAPFGFLPAVWVPGRCPSGETTPGVRVARICPAMIARQIQHRSEQDQEDYLRAISLHVSLHLVHRDNPDVESLIDDLMWDTSPGVMRTMSDIQLGALSPSR